MKIGGVPQWPQRLAPGGQPADRAAGFEELGMFGVSRSQPGAPTTDSEAAGSARSEPEELPRLRCPASMGPGAPKPAPRLSSSGKAPFAAEPVPPARRAGPMHGTSKGGSVDAAPAAPQDPGITDSSEPVTSGQSARASLRAPQAAPRVSLALHEKDGAVEIVAAAPEIDSQARIELRRLLQAMLARSGLALMQFQLNGRPVGPDFQAKAGGPDGARTN